MYSLRKHILFTLITYSSCFSKLSYASPEPEPSPSPSPKIQTSYYGMLSSRYDFSKTTPGNFKRLQESVVFGFTISPHGVVELVGMLQTGSSYAKKFQTAIDFNDHSKDMLSPTLYFKHLYLQKSFEAFQTPVSLQAGIIGTNQKIGTQTALGPVTAVGTNAWIDGGRINVQTNIGDFSISTGSVSDTIQPEIQKRDRDFNYLEIQMTKKVFDKLAFEASGGSFDSEVFFRGAVEYDVETVSHHMIRLIQEGLYNQGTLSYSTAVSSDIGSIIHKKMQGRFSVDLRYAYLAPDNTFRNQMMNDLTLKGHVFSIATYGKLDKSGKLTWFAAKDFVDLNRFQAGLNWKFKGGNKK